MASKQEKRLREIAAEFDFSPEEFISQFLNYKLPAGGAYTTDGEPSHAELALFKTSCSNPHVWKQLEAIARYNGRTAQQECADAILGKIQMFNDDVIFSPKSGQIIAEREEVRDLWRNPGS